jgi:hypothetical protein
MVLLILTLLYIIKCVTPGYHGDLLKNYLSIEKKNRYLRSCYFKGKGLVQEVAT